MYGHTLLHDTSGTLSGSLIHDSCRKRILLSCYWNNKLETTQGSTETGYFNSIFHISLSLLSVGYMTLNMVASYCHCNDENSLLLGSYDGQFLVLDYGMWFVKVITMFIYIVRKNVILCLRGEGV